MNKLTLRSRLRLFFYGAIRELEVASAALRELRQYRDGLNALVGAIVNTQPPQHGAMHLLVDAVPVLRIVEQVYGVDHPWVVVVKAQIEHAKLQRAVHEAKQGFN